MGGAFTLGMAGAAVWKSFGSVASVASADASPSSSGAAQVGAGAGVVPDEPSVLKSSQIVLMQYEICPYCNKIKTLLDYFDVPYTVVEVNPLRKQELAFSPGYRKVPVAVINGEQVNDSPVIMERLMDMLKADKMLPSEEFVNADVLKWLHWADRKLAVLLFPNICRNYGEAMEAFSYLEDVPTLSKTQKMLNHYLGGGAMWLANGKIKKKYGITDERQAVYDCLKVWSDRLGEDNFHGGDSPNLADLVVFGVIRSIRHTKTHQDLLDNTSIGAWYGRMEQQVGESSCKSRFPPEGWTEVTDRLRKKNDADIEAAKALEQEEQQQQQQQQQQQS